jgi:hypothetical protein
MEQTQNPISKYQLLGKTITVNTLDGKAITGKLITEESNWLTIDVGTGFSFVVQSAIASVFVNMDQKLPNPPALDPRIKSLPQTPLKKQ